ncbi:DUF2844 domain-containing protein [bacterium]|jgi:hypothetical protein|nr:DUF2844 domain-containing protein [bacterium]
MLGLALSLLLLLPSVCQAVLGEPESSVAQDRKFSATKTYRKRTQNVVSVHELVSDALTIREFAANGIIFAVAWNGMSHPDVSQLFGKQFEIFRQQNERVRKLPGRGPGKVDAGNLVVEYSGHMRSVRGRAYLLNQIPPGFSLEDIQ